MLANAKENASKLSEANRDIVQAFVDAFVESKKLDATIAGFPGKIDAALSSACQLALKMAAVGQAAASAASNVGKIEPGLSEPLQSRGNPHLERISTSQTPSSRPADEPSEASGSFLNQQLFGRSNSTFALAFPTDSLDRQSDALNENATFSNEASLAHQLLTQTQASGVPITDELGDGVAILSSKYMTAASGAMSLASNQAELQQVATQFNSIAKDALGGFINDLRNGTSAADALENALRRIEDRLINIALDAIFPSSGGGLFGGLLGGASSGGGVLGGLFGFKNGGQVKGFAAGGLVAGPGGGRSDSIPALLSNGEFVANAQATRNNRPLLEAINAGSFNLKRINKFADGGIVPADQFNQRLAGLNTRLAPRPAAGASDRPVVVEPQVNLRNINAFDADEVVSQVLSGPAGEKAMLNMVRARPAAFRGALGV